MIKHKIVTKTSGIKCNLILTLEEKKLILEFVKRFSLLCNHASRNFSEILQNVEIFNTIKNAGYSTAIKSTADKVMRDYAPIDDKREELGFKLKIFNRMAAHMAAKYYIGFDARNGTYDDETVKLSSIPSTSNYKSVHLLDNCGRFTILPKDFEFDQPYKNNLAKCNNAKINLAMHNGERHEFQFAVRKVHTDLIKQLVNKPVYGNLIVKLRYNRDNTINISKTHFAIMVMVKHEVEPLYQPIGAVGVDFNERKSVFAVFSDENFQAIDVRNDTVHLQLIKDIKDTQEQIKNSFGIMDSKSRRILRLKWKSLLEQSKQHMYKHYVLPLVNQLIEYEYLICIDDLKFPDKSGFGYYQFKEMLLNECYKRNIPHVLVPTWHTSTDCNYCFQTTGRYVQTGRSKELDKVSCPKCKNVYHADINAAKNIRDDGLNIWNDKKRTRPNKSNRAERPKYFDYEFEEILF